MHSVSVIKKPAQLDLQHAKATLLRAPMGMDRAVATNCSLSLTAKEEHVGRQVKDTKAQLTHRFCF